MCVKVLMFGWEFPPHNSGGLGTACFGLTKAMSALPAEVLFVLPKRVKVSADFMKMFFADIQNISLHQVDTILYPYITMKNIMKFIGEVKNNLYGRNLLEEVKLYGERGAVIKI